MSTPRTAVAAAVLVLAALVAPTSVAGAAEPTTPAMRATPAEGAPVTQADHVTVAADSGAEVDVLANDVDPDRPTDDDLAICRVEPSADNPFNIYPTTGYDGESDVAAGGHPVLDVFPLDAAPGTYTFTYYVCDYDYLTAATLTVEVTDPQNPYATVLSARPGHVRFHNPGERRTVIQYGSRDGHTVDGKFALAPHKARTVRITRHVIQWTATIRTPHSETTFGSILGGIEQPDRQSRTTSARPAARTAADRTAWRLGTRQNELRSRARVTQQVSPVTASRDESTDAPVTAPDTAEVSQGFFAFADVLANDSDPDGAGDDLGICRASTPAGSDLEATPLAGNGPFAIMVVGRRAPAAMDRATGDPVPYTLLLQTGRKAQRGTYQVTYYACDRQYLTPSTVTVKVTRSQVITAHEVEDRPGVVRFTNPGPHGARVQIRSLDDAEQSHRRPPLVARFALPADTSKSVRVHARSIVWSASSRRGPGGFGFLDGIGRPPRG